MQISLVNDVRSKPSPKLKGVCQYCGMPAISKCGNKVAWHWAHKSFKNCDTWWENETEWHRTWKNKWPVECQEVVHFDSSTGEKHIADVKLKDNTVIEIQNSPMSESELLSREKFYKNMLWIVNGEKFKTKPNLLHKLPNPENEVSRNLCIYPPNLDDQHEFLFHWLSDVSPDSNLVEVHGSRRLSELINETHVGHWLFYWKRPPSVWLKSQTQVFFDFGHDYLFKLEVFNNRSPYCFLPISKKQFLSVFDGGKA